MRSRRKKWGGVQISIELAEELRFLYAWNIFMPAFGRVYYAVNCGSSKLEGVICEKIGKIYS
jgi:hypothetical protein